VRLSLQFYYNTIHSASKVSFCYNLICGYQVNCVGQETWSGLNAANFVSESTFAHRYHLLPAGWNNKNNLFPACADLAVAKPHKIAM
jgi:hypothetical protein